MKMIESADGSIKVVELDPTKLYWIFLDQEAAQRLDGKFRKKDGMIYVVPNRASVQIVENIDRIQGVTPV